MSKSVEKIEFSDEIHEVPAERPFRKNLILGVLSTLLAVLVVSVGYYAVSRVITDTVPTIDAHIQAHYRQLVSDLNAYRHQSGLNATAAQVESVLGESTDLFQTIAGDPRFQAVAIDAATRHSRVLELLSPTQQFLLYCYERALTPDASCQDLAEFILTDLRDRVTSPIFKK